jgi:hypothetical protein
MAEINMVSLGFQGYALLIGVGACEYPKLSLPVTVKDAEALKRILVDPELCGYPTSNICLLSNALATQKGILDGLDQLKEQVEQDRQATAIVFYSGHGWLDESGDYYLLPHDFDSMDPQESAVAAVEFTERLQSIRADRLLVIMDCCHAEGMATAKGTTKREKFKTGLVPPQKSMFSPLVQKLGRAVFTSCSGKQSSWVRKDKSMSIFTFHLIEALQGAGSQPGDITVTVSHLMKHLGQTVSTTAQRDLGVEQNPQFDFKTEDFSIALLRGGKGLPSEGYETIQSHTSGGAQTQLISSGEQSVTIAGHMDGGIIITGNSNIVRS